MATLTLRVESGKRISERIYARTPVFIGREVGPGHCRIDDSRSSKLHATIDVRDGQIWVRDASSTNGTFCGDTSLEPDRWTALGPAQRPVQFRVGASTITAWASEQEGAGTAINSGTLGGMLAGVATPGSNPSAPPPVLSQTAALPDNSYVAGPVGRLGPAAAQVVDALAALEVLLDQELAAAPRPHRPAISQMLLQARPQLATCSTIARRLGGHSDTVRANGDSTAATAQAALQELVNWYLGSARPLNRPEEILAFQQRLRATLDDFLLGFPPLLAGLNQFESQMAIRLPNASGSGAQISAADLARALLDWQVSDEPTRSELRASLTELTMHQVALLKGVMRGVKALLEELSPEVIEQAAEREGNVQGGVRRIFGRADPWATYKRRHSDLSDEENERFRVLFGRDFVNEYRQFSREARGEKPGPEGERK